MEAIVDASDVGVVVVASGGDDDPRASGLRRERGEFRQDRLEDRRGYPLLLVVGHDHHGHFGDGTGARLREVSLVTDAREDRQAIDRSAHELQGRPPPPPERQAGQADEDLPAARSPRVDATDHADEGEGHADERYQHHQLPGPGHAATEHRYRTPVVMPTRPIALTKLQKPQGTRRLIWAGTWTMSPSATGKSGARPAAMASRSTVKSRWSPAPIERFTTT